MSKLDELIKKYSSLTQKEEERAIKLDSVNHYRMASFYKNILEDLESLEPELNENQLVVLEWLKKYKDSPIGGVYLLHKSAFDATYFDSIPVEIYRSLDKKQEYELLAAFAEWGLNR